MNNPNTGRPWSAGEDYHWENPRWSLYGLRNPNADYNHILFFPERFGVLVCWVNTQSDSRVEKYVNNREYKTFDEARHLWKCLNHPDRVGVKWIRDDSIPPRMIHPKHPDSGWGKGPEYSVKMKEITNYALEA